MLWLGRVLESPGVGSMGARENRLRKLPSVLMLLPCPSPLRITTLRKEPEDMKTVLLSSRPKSPFGPHAPPLSSSCFS